MQTALKTHRRDTLYLRLAYPQVIDGLGTRAKASHDKMKNITMLERIETVMKAVITVTGKDSVGIIARVSATCAECGANIVDISQSVLKEYFAMVMVAEIDALNIPFDQFVDTLSALGTSLGLSIYTMHEDIFNTMHRIWPAMQYWQNINCDNVMFVSIMEQHRTDIQTNKLLYMQIRKSNVIEGPQTEINGNCS